jgi:mono/diheme cytochrome c family protein
MRSRLSLAFLILPLGGLLSFAQHKPAGKKAHSSGLANAPESAHALVNPFDGKSEAPLAGHKLFERHCAECHGSDARGRGKAPALDSYFVGNKPPGDLFWFLTNGNLRAGMPSWSGLPEERRWQIIAYLKTLRE